MKLHLDENLFEDYIVESNSLLKLLSNQKYNPTSFWRSLSAKELLQTQLGRELKNKGYIAHHINGIHPTSMADEYNDVDNIALIPRNIHKDITKQNNEVVKETLQNSFEDATLGKYIVELLTYANNENINLDKYFDMKENNYNEIVANIKNNIVQKFLAYKDSYNSNENNDKIYLLSDLINER